MKISYLVHYMLADFLMDIKEELYKLDKKYKETTDKEKREEIKRERERVYQQGLKAIKYHRWDLPDCVRRYYFGYDDKPTWEEINNELHEMYARKRLMPKDEKPIKIVTVLVLIALAIWAIFFN